MSEFSDHQKIPKHEQRQVKIETGVDENYIKIIGNDDMLWEFAQNFAEAIRGENFLDETSKDELFEKGYTIRIGSIFGLSYDKMPDNNQIVVQIVNGEGNKEYIKQLQRAVKNATNK